MSCDSSLMEFTESENSLNRIYSEETDESPFTSNLVTPTDEDPHIGQGIHERLDAAETALGYFASEDLAAETEKVQEVVHQITVPDVECLGTANKEEKCSTLEDENTQPPGDLESMDPIPSPFLPSSSSESIRRPSAGSIYTLPNDHILIESSSDISNASLKSMQDEARPLLESDSIPIIKKPDLGPSFWLKELEPLIDALTVKALISISIKVICFVPWCVAVGGALILSPEHLDYIAFRPGYIEALSGIRRYAHWAEYGHQHVTAFLGCLAVLVWAFPNAGLLLIGGLLAQFCSAWHTFLFDRNIPLGEDDRQTVFLLAKSTWLNNTSVDIRKIGDSYYSTGITTNDVHSFIDDSE